MTVGKGAFAIVPNAVDPSNFNPNAFNLLTYTRPERESPLLFFQDRPAGGHSRIEDILSAGSARSFTAPASVASTSTVTSGWAPAAAALAQVTTGGQRGAVVPFLEAVYPMAVMFNTATGAWTSAQAEAAVATVDRTSVFRALESVSGQEAAGLVVESPNQLADAVARISARAGTALIASSTSPACHVMKLLDTQNPLPAPAEVYSATVASSVDHRLVVMPFVGLKAGQREICCDGILVDGEVAFCAFSEKKRVDPDPPYRDRRITTLDVVDGAMSDQLNGVTVQVLGKLGVKLAVFHVEYSLTAQGPLLSDLMTRPGGGLIPEMVKARHNIDLRAAHVYASFSMRDDLLRIAKEAKDTGEGVAIASCYGVKAGSAQDASISDFVDALGKNKAVLAYDVVGEFSSSVVGNPDFRASLAVVDKNADAALRLLDSIVNAHGLD